jgi:hypothetical protein
MATHKIKQGDNARLVEDYLTLDGAPLDLTGGTVLFLMKNVNGGTAINKNATVVAPATGGHVSVLLSSTDTANWGQYYVEWQVTFGDGSILTCPDDGYANLEIVRDLQS